MTTKAYAAQSADSELSPWQLDRRDPQPDDVAIDILYCGVCHSDIHMAENDWGASRYPVVPGHEIVGRVTAVGNEVTKYKAGDMVGVGCLVDSCRDCDPCRRGLEQYCSGGYVPTYNGVDKYGQTTYGGYSERIVVSERFVVRIPNALDPAAAAPLLCAGITTYSPLKYCGIQPGHTVGVVGMGGLGHMGIKLARAMGADVTLFTRSEHKRDEAMRNGAHNVVVSTDKTAMRNVKDAPDFILDTVPVEHDLNPYLKTLKYDGTYILVGQLTPVEPPLSAGALVSKRKKLMGSLIGGLPETQEVLDFCAEHDITCDIELLDIRDINTAYQRMKNSDVKYRFVIDMQTLKDT